MNETPGAEVAGARVLSVDQIVAFLQVSIDTLRWKPDYRDAVALVNSHESLRRRLHELDEEAARLTAFAESFPGVSVTGFCKSCRRCVKDDGHAPSCLWVAAQRAIAPKGETDDRS